MKSAPRPLKLRPIKLPKVEKLSLSNGLKLHVVTRGPLPLVSLRLVIRAGGAFDPPGQFGVADFASRLFRRGAAGLSADAISEAVEFVGASVGAWANEENVVVSLSTPARHLEAMLEMLGHIVLRPDFLAQEIELNRRRTLAQLTSELDDPGALADRALTRATWGEHPYGHETSGTKKALEALTRDELVRFHRDRLGPRISNLFIVGDAKTSAVQRSVERIFGGWKGGPAAAPPIPAWKGPANPRQVVIVDKPDQTQVQVRIGALGVKRGHDDHFPIGIMNTVLGGGFTSRLVTEIRVKRGLSYGAGSSFDMLTGAGTFSVSSFTKTETVQTLVDVALGEVAKMRRRGPTALEVATVQRYIAGLYPARLETNEAISGSLADVEHYGLPEDWIGSYRERITAVTVEEAAAAASRHLFQDDRVVVFVGNAKALAPRVKQYGPVSIVQPSDLT